GLGWIGHSESGRWILHIHYGNRIGRLVVPGLEVRDLCSADAEQNAQDFDVRHLLRQSEIHAGSAHLYIGEVKACSVGNGLEEVRIVQIVISPRNSRMRSNN